MLAKNNIELAVKSMINSCLETKHTMVLKAKKQKKFYEIFISVVSSKIRRILKFLSLQSRTKYLEQNRKIQ